MDWSSDQERLVHALTEFSLGAPFLFTPDLYRKAKGQREPADLAWAGWDVVFLIAMQSGRRSVEEQHSHNLKQLRGFIRLWGPGLAPLRGTNDFQSFDIQYEDLHELVLLSVVDHPDAHLAILPEILTSPRNEFEASVTLVVSMPQQVLHRLAELGGTALDLADLVLRASGDDQPVPTATAVAWLNEHHAESIRRAPSPPKYNDVQAAIEQSVRLDIRGFRQSPQPSNKVKWRRNDFFSIVNDLDWEQIEELVQRCVLVVDAVWVEPGQTGATATIGRFETDRYLILLGAHVPGKVDETTFTESLDPHFKDVPGATTWIWIVVWTPEPMAFASMIMSNRLPPGFRSATGETLRLARETVLPSP